MDTYNGGSMTVIPQNSNVFQPDETSSVSNPNTGTVQNFTIQAEAGQVYSLARNVQNDFKNFSVPIPNGGGVFDKLKDELRTLHRTANFVKEGLKGLFNPALVMGAVFSAAIREIISLWDRFTESSDEYSQKMDYYAKKAETRRKAEEKIHDALSGNVNRLRELNELESEGSAGREETLSLLDRLTAQYGDLGAVIDQTTGRILNMMEVEERADQEKRKQMASHLSNEINRDQMAFDAKFINTLMEGGKSYSEAYHYVKHSFKSLSQRAQRDILENMAKSHRSQEFRENGKDLLNRHNSISQKQGELSLLRTTGFRTKEEREAAINIELQSLTGKQKLKEKIEKQQKEEREREERNEADKRFREAASPEEKIQNREHIVQGIKKERDKNQEKINALKSKVKSLQQPKAQDDDETKDKLKEIRLQNYKADLEIQIQTLTNENDKITREINNLNEQIAKVSGAPAQIIDGPSSESASVLRQNAGTNPPAGNPLPAQKKQAAATVRSADEKNGAEKPSRVSKTPFAPDAPADVRSADGKSGAENVSRVSNALAPDAPADVRSADGKSGAKNVPRVSNALAPDAPADVRPADGKSGAEDVPRVSNALAPDAPADVRPADGKSGAEDVPRVSKPPLAPGAPADEQHTTALVGDGTPLNIPPSDAPAAHAEDIGSFALRGGFAANMQGTDNVFLHKQQLDKLSILATLTEDIRKYTEENAKVLHDISKT